MTKLEECRNKIDEIDTKIIELFEARMETVEEVVKYKAENGLPITDTNREIDMFKRNVKKFKNEKYSEYYLHILQGFIKASKELQMDILEDRNRLF